MLNTFELQDVRCCDRATGLHAAPSANQPVLVCQPDRQNCDTSCVRCRSCRWAARGVTAWGDDVVVDLAVV